MKQRVLPFVLLAVVTAAVASAQRTYSGVFDTARGTGQVALFGISEATWRNQTAALAASGLVPSHIEAYRDANSTAMRFDATWHLGPNPARVIAFGISSSTLIQAFTAEINAGARVLSFASYLVPSGSRFYHVSFSPRGVTNGGALLIGVSASAFSSEVARLSSLGLQVQFMEAYEDENAQLLYDAVFEPSPRGSRFRTGMTQAQFDAYLLANLGSFRLQTYETRWSVAASGVGTRLYDAVLVGGGLGGGASYAFRASEALSTFGPAINQNFTAGSRGLRCFESRFAGTQPSALTYGPSFGLNGRAPTISMPLPPMIGRRLQFNFSDNNPASTTSSAAALLLGFQQANFPLLGGRLLLNPFGSIALTLPAGGQPVSLSLPGLNELGQDGTTLYTQLWQLVPVVTTGVLHSRGVQIVVGRYD